MDLGIDFGTCYSSAALLVDGLPTPVRFGHNLTSLPSCVYEEEQGNLLVGFAAEHRGQREPGRLKCEFKRELEDYIPYVGAVLKALKQAAEQQQSHGDSLTSAVLTVPARYEEHQRFLMVEAATLAGFDPPRVQILSEPEAAALYYVWRNRESQGIEDGDIFLIYDLGGGTFDASLLQKRGDSYELLTLPVGSEKNLPVGGAEFDLKISQDLRRRCSPALREAIERKDLQGERARLLLRDQCIELKHRLSEVDEAVLTFPLTSLEEYVLTRQAFEGMIAPLIVETVEQCRDMVEGKAGLRWEQVQRVVMVGGSCRIPYVRSMLGEMLGRLEDVVLVDNPELAVCLGAALYGMELERRPTKAKSKSKKAAGVKCQNQTTDVGAATGKRWSRPAVLPSRVVRTLTGHDRMVVSVAFSPDGLLIASGSQDNTIGLWNVKNGLKTHTLVPKERPRSVWRRVFESIGLEGRGVHSVMFSPDGRLLASGMADGMIRLWEVTSGQELRTLHGHSYEVHSVAFSPDGRLLASGGFAPTIRLWEVASGRELRTLSGHENWVRSMTFSPDGRLLAVGIGDNTIKLWEVGSGRELRTLSGHKGLVNSITFSPNGRLLASGSRDGTIKLWQ